jgi:Response regulator containing a CheY-like receiver domain and an HTH DNA-binding domain
MGSPLTSPALSGAPPEPSASRIRVLVADETAMGAQLLKNSLSHSRFRLEVVGYATTCSELLQKATEVQADVVLISETLGGGSLSGFQALAQLHRQFPTLRVIMLLKSASRDLVIDAFRAGAKGVICKSEPVQVLSKCVKSVHKGQIWANSQFLHFVLEALMRSTPLRVTNTKGRALLGQRENEVASLVADGMSNRGIARKLGIAEHTVSNYLFRIYEKLGISSRVELVLYVLREFRQT